MVYDTTLTVRRDKVVNKYSIPYGEVLGGEVALCSIPPAQFSLMVSQIRLAYPLTRTLFLIIILNEYSFSVVNTNSSHYDS
jgi:hypothetical protein